MMKRINADYKWYNGKPIKCLRNSFSIENTMALIVTSNGELIQYTNNHKLGIFDAKENYGSFTVSANGIGGKLSDYYFNFNNDPVYQTLINERTDKRSLSVINVNKSSKLFVSFFTNNRFKIYFTNKNSPNLFKEYKMDTKNENIHSLILISSTIFYQDVLFFRKDHSGQWFFRINNNWNNKTIQGFICQDFFDPNQIIFEQKQCNRFHILDNVQSAFIFDQTIYLFSFKKNLVWTLDKKLLIKNKSARLIIHEISNIIECNEFGKVWHWILIIMAIVISPFLCYFMFDSNKMETKTIDKHSTNPTIKLKTPRMQTKHSKHSSKF